MSLGVVLAIIGGITRNALVRASGLLLAGLLIVLWLVVGGIEYARHR